MNNRFNPVQEESLVAAIEVARSVIAQLETIDSIEGTELHKAVQNIITTYEPDGTRDPEYAVKMARLAKALIGGGSHVLATTGLMGQEEYASILYAATMATHKINTERQAALFEQAIKKQ